MRAFLAITYRAIGWGAAIFFTLPLWRRAQHKSLHPFPRPYSRGSFINQCQLKRGMIAFFKRRRGENKKMWFLFCANVCQKIKSRSHDFFCSSLLTMEIAWMRRGKERERDLWWYGRRRTNFSCLFDFSPLRRNFLSCVVMASSCKDARTHARMKESENMSAS